MTEIDEINQIELHTDEVRELLSQMPKTIVRRGIAIITIVLVVLITGSAFFKYPDILVAKIILTTQNPPVNLTAKVNGKIEKLLVQNNQKVKPGEIIAMLETAAILEDIIEAEKISARSMEDLNAMNEIDKGRNLQLGEMQSYFSAFTKAFSENFNFVRLNYHQRKILALKQESSKYDVYYRKLEEQLGAQEKEYKLTLKQFKRDSTLFSQAVISNSDFERSESVLMEKMYDLKETESTIEEAKIQVSRLNQQILDLELEYDKEKKQHENLLYEAYERLKAEIEIWKKTYLLMTPISGKINYMRFWSENQQVTEGEIVFSVIPEDTGKIVGKISLSVDGAGKVRPGQMVNIKLSTYPYIEFGLIKGKIISLSQVPDKNFYNADVELTEGLITNYGIPVEFKQEIPGIAEIITDDLSLLQRILNPVKAVMKKQVN